MHPDSIRMHARERLSDLGPPTAGEPASVPTGQPDPAIVIRPARASDRPEISRLAELEERRPPDGPALVAEVAGEVTAATPLDGGPTLADPFRSTEDVVSLLRLRAEQVSDRRAA